MFHEFESAKAWIEARAAAHEALKDQPEAQESLRETWRREDRIHGRDFHLTLWGTGEPARIESRFSAMGYASDDIFQWKKGEWRIARIGTDKQIRAVAHLGKTARELCEAFCQDQEGEAGS